jgi:hypothetical protein
MIGGVFAPYLFWLKWGTISAVVVALIAFVTVCNGRGIKLEALEQRQVEWVVERSALNRELAERNTRIDKINSDWIEKLAQERKRLIIARVEAAKVRQQRDAVTDQLARAIADLNEDAKNDEQLAKWLLEPVPAAAWRRLRDSSAAPGN